MNDDDLTSPALARALALRERAEAQAKAVLENTEARLQALIEEGNRRTRESARQLAASALAPSRLRMEQAAKACILRTAVFDRRIQGGRLDPRLSKPNSATLGLGRKAMVGPRPNGTRWMSILLAAKLEWPNPPNLDATLPHALRTQAFALLRFKPDSGDGSPMIIRLTQKLGKKIGVSPKASLPLAGDPYADWTGHLFTARRVQYILLVNTSSMFSVVVFGRGITHDGSFLKMALMGIREAAVDAIGELAYQRHIAPATGQIQFSKTSDRRVLGSINELVFQAKVNLEDDELSPSQLADRLNNTLLSLIKYQKPKEAFRSLGLAAPDGNAGDEITGTRPKPPTGSD